MQIRECKEEELIPNVVYSFYILFLYSLCTLFVLGLFSFVLIILPRYKQKLKNCIHFVLGLYSFVLTILPSNKGKIKIFVLVLYSLCSLFVLTILF